MSKILVAGGVDQVQSYLLASPLLHQIRGGSQLLAELEGDAVAALTAAGATRAVASAGWFLAEFPDVVTARVGSTTLRGTIARAVPAASFWVSQPVEAPDFGRALGLVFEQKRDAAGRTHSPVPDVPYARPCGICRVRPARARLRKGTDLLDACDDCLRRSDADRRASTPASGSPATPRSRLQASLAPLGVLPASEQGGRPATIDDLARTRPPGYVGYLAADGNAIGASLQRLAAEPDAGLDLYETFATSLDDATRLAVVDAVKAVLAAEPADGQTMRVLPVVAGGDDVLLFTTPAHAVALAIEFASAFETRTEAEVGECFTTSVGVVIAHSSTPFSALDDVAHRLQRSAKRIHRRTTAEPISAVAFRLVHAGAEADPECLDAAAPLPRRSLGAHAYTLDDAQLLLGHARALAASSPPWSKLKHVDRILRQTDGAAGADWELFLAAPSLAGGRAALWAAAQLPSESTPLAVAPWRRTEHDGGVSAIPDLLALAELS